MKKLLLTLLFLCFLISGWSQSDDTTIYYLVRHAEKDRTDKTNRNPELTIKGHARAANYAVLFKNVKFDMIYSTNYHRTIQTAKPTADDQGIEISFYDPKAMYNDEFKRNTKGKTVLVVGHSNTTPFFVNKILGMDKYKEIDDSNNSNLYIVTIQDGNMYDQLLYIDQ